MEARKEEYYSFIDITTVVKSLLRYTKQRWWLFLVSISIGLCVGIAYHRIQKPKYKATTTFILEEKTSGGGGLVGLASQFGFDLGGIGGGGSIFSGDNILNILRSKKIIQQVLLSKVDNSKQNNSQTLVDLYIDFTGLKKSWRKNGRLAGTDFNIVTSAVSPIQDSILNIIYETIIKKHLVIERTSKQGTIIKAEVSASNALFSRLMTERLVDEASKLYLEIRVGTSQENIRQLQRRSDSLLLLLNNKSYRVAATQPLDINPGIKTAFVPVEIATRDKAVLSTLYAEVTKNLEASKMILSQQTPVIQVLDRPGYLLEDHRKSLFFLILFSSLVAGFLCLVWVFLSFLLYKMKAKTL